MDNISEKNTEIVNDNNAELQIAEQPLNTLSVLPQISETDTSSDDFRETALAVLDKNNRNEIIELDRNQRILYSRFECLLHILIIIGIVAIFYHVMKKPAPKIVVVDYMPASAITFSKGYEVAKGSPEWESFQKMKDSFENRNYQECIISDEEINSIVSNKEKLAKYKLSINLYLEAIYRINFQAEKKQQYIQKAANICRALIAKDPDSAAWHLHLLRFENYDIIANNSYTKLRLNKKNGAELDRLQKTIKSFEHIKYDEFDEKTQIMADVCKSKIYIACWLHCVPYDDSQTLSDNDNGVREREEAYRLLSKFAEKSLVATELQEFIVEKMKQLEGITSSYYFKGTKYYREKHLDEELKLIHYRKAQLQKTLNEQKGE